ncbi:hypothetical protein BD626DRAFT_220496 [Schizophyllum amplum]|uniref:Uncharacterized protein n=1 Tax=Schizophyllum amplum TaxID=97359 RepID=A0A550CL71_9AGAR|nr:hypothetical protein BD626DRAFT_220496 [Auriculariopsis ampla]
MLSKIYHCPFNISGARALTLTLHLPLHLGARPPVQCRCALIDHSPHPLACPLEAITGTLRRRATRRSSARLPGSDRCWPYYLPSSAYSTAFTTALVAGDRSVRQQAMQARQQGGMTHANLPPAKSNAPKTRRDNHTNDCRRSARRATVDHPGCGFLNSSCPAPVPSFTVHALIRLVRVICGLFSIICGSSSITFDLSGVTCLARPSSALLPSACFAHRALSSLLLCSTIAPHLTRFSSHLTCFAGGPYPDSRARLFRCFAYRHRRIPCRYADDGPHI